jgi:hypothetical protein
MVNNVPPLHYIIFHPDYAREKLIIKGRAIINNGMPESWTGAVWVDAAGGNEDPFVLCENWLYSYCHATQLRRTPSSKRSYVMEGSYLFFCSGDAANRGELQVDTVFVVGHVARWPRDGQGLPSEFQEYYQDTNSDLWNYHFRFPFSGQHEGIYTYVAKAWSRDAEDYSFLPIHVSGSRVGFSLDTLTRALKKTIQDKVYGKRPVPMEENDKNEILKSLSLAPIKVIQVHTRRHQQEDRKRTACSRPCNSIASKINPCG